MERIFLSTISLSMWLWLAMTEYNWISLQGFPQHRHQFPSTSHYSLQTWQTCIYGGWICTLHLNKVSSYGLLWYSLGARELFLLCCRRWWPRAKVESKNTPWHLSIWNRIKQQNLIYYSVSIRHMNRLANPFTNTSRVLCLYGEV